MLMRDRQLSSASIFYLKKYWGAKTVVDNKARCPVPSFLLHVTPDPARAARFASLAGWASACPPDPQTDTNAITLCHQTCQGRKSSTIDLCNKLEDEDMRSILKGREPQVCQCASRSVVPCHRNRSLLVYTFVRAMLSLMHSLSRETVRFALMLTKLSTCTQRDHLSQQGGHTAKFVGMLKASPRRKQR